jgi:hypothetical protein
MPRKKNENHFLLTSPCITLMEEKSKPPNFLFTNITLHHPDGRKIKTT